MKALAGYVMRGPWQAAGVAALFGALSWLLPPAAVVSSATVALVALRRGLAAGGRVVLGATLGSAVVAISGFGVPLPAFAQALLMWLPVLIVAGALRSSVSQGWMLIAAGCVAGLFGLIMRIAFGDVDQWWHDLAGRLAHQPTIRDFGPGFEMALTALASYMNGLVASSILLNIVCSVLLARWWQSLLYKPGGFREEFHTLRLPPRLIWLFLVNAIVIVVLQQTGSSAGLFIDIFVLLMTMYVFQGLALAHHAYGRGGTIVWLVAIYGGLLIFAPHVLVVLSAVGLTDSVLNFRRLGNADSDAQV
jgi:hypothetical protein